MNIVSFFHLINRVQLLYRLLKVVLQGGEEVSVSGSEHIKRWTCVVSKKLNKQCTCHWHKGPTCKLPGYLDSDSRELWGQRCPSWPSSQPAPSRPHRPAFSSSSYCSRRPRSWPHWCLHSPPASWKDWDTHRSSTWRSLMVRLNLHFCQEFLNTCSKPPLFPKCASQTWQTRDHWAGFPLATDTPCSASPPRTWSGRCPGSGGWIGIWGDFVQSRMNSMSEVRALDKSAVDAIFSPVCQSWTSH